MHWSEWRMPDSGRIVASDFHSHGALGLHSLWVVVGAAAASLRLPARTAVGRPVAVKSVDVAQAGVRAALLEGAKDSGAVSVSEGVDEGGAKGEVKGGKGGAAEELRRAPDGKYYTKAVFVTFYGGSVEWNAAAPGGAGGAGALLCVVVPNVEDEFDRAPRVMEGGCSRWEFKKGETLTIIAFHDAPAACSSSGGGAGAGAVVEGKKKGEGCFMHVAWLPLVAWGDAPS